MASKVPTVLFICPHGAAKSVIAASYFHQMATQRGIAVTTESAGTDPDPAVPPAVVAALGAEGFDVSAYRPRPVMQGELAAADRVVSLGAELDDLAPVGTTIERWDDVPPPSQGVERACAAIREHVVRLLDTWETTGSDAPMPAKRTEGDA